MAASLSKSSVCLLLAVSAVFSSCLKGAPDSPPDTTQQDPGIIANTTIQQLKSLPQGSEINKDIIISGVIIMSDQSGNYFKKIVVQDSTGGIEIDADQSYLYADFPVGRKVFVKCRGLFLSEKNGMLSLGITPDANGYVQPIPQPLIRNFLIPGQFPVYLRPDTVSLTQLAVPKDAQKYLNTLVCIKNVEFADSNSSVPFAQPSDISPATTRIIRDCSGATIDLVTSGYANFQATPTPQGNGTLTAVYTRYDQQAQLIIRNPDDLHFNQARCAALPNSGSLLTILQFRQLFSGLVNNVTLGAFKITGVVISDKNFKNIATNAFVMQGGSHDAGIMVLLNQPNTFNPGDSLLINVNGGKLTSYYGSLAIKNLSATAFQLVGQNKTIKAQTATVSQIKANPQSFDSRLVQIQQIHWLQFPASFNGLSGNLAFSDNTDSMNHFCRLEATFRNNSLPQATANSISGFIFIRNNRAYLNMRNPDLPEDDLKE